MDIVRRASGDRGGCDHDALAGRSHVTNLVFGPVAREPVIGVNVRVMRDGRPVYALAMTMLPASRSAVLSDQTLPEGWVGTILDRAGIVVARSRSPEHSVGGPPSACRRELLALDPSGGSGMTITLEGAPVITTWSRSPHYDWIFAVGAPPNQLVATARHTAALMLTLGVLALAAGSVLAVAVARRNTRPIEALAATVERLGRGYDGAGASTGLRATDDVMRRRQEPRPRSSSARRRYTRARSISARLLETLPHIAVVLRPDGTSEYHNERFVGEGARGVLDG